MKTRRIILLLCGIVLLNSCVLKSLHPFYIQSAISYQKELIGKWEDDEDGIWHIQPFKVFMNVDIGNSKKKSKEDQEILEKYKNAYAILYTKKEKEATFITTPFQINGKLFLDFTPFDGVLEHENQLLTQHLFKSHSIAKVIKNKDGSIRFAWLDESKIEELQKAEKLKLKHEKLGVDNDFILTASSNELYKFLEKFEATNNDEVWGSDANITMKRIDAKP